MELAERVAIVTGGAQGIGGATARRLAEQGARVLIADIDMEVGASNVATIRGAGGTVDLVHADVGKSKDIEAMVSKAIDLWGRLDIPVNNAFDAGSAGTGGAVEVTEDDWDRDLAILVKSIFLVGGFFTYWASSSTTRCQAIPLSVSRSRATSA